VRVATYLLAEGQFVTSLHEAASGLGTVAPPLGVHPALVRLVWERYDAGPP
jgi:sirohydrochlorin ferrochelatase